MMRSPLMALVAGCGALLILAIPFFDMKTGIPRMAAPDFDHTKRAFIILEREFFGNHYAPILVTIKGDLTDPAMAKRLKRRPGGPAERLELVLGEAARPAARRHQAGGRRRAGPGPGGHGGRALAFRREAVQLLRPWLRWTVASMAAPGMCTDAMEKRSMSGAMR